MRPILLACLMLLCPPAFAQGAAETTYMLGVQSKITGLAAPDSVLHHGQRHFVSNLGRGGPLEADGNGFIAEIDDYGSIKTQKAFPTGEDRLDAPKGMAVIGDVLYVADIRRIVGFSLGDGRQLSVLEAGTAIEGLAALADGRLLAVDTGAGRLLSIDVSTADIRTVADVRGIGAVAAGPDGTAIVAASTGLQRLPLADGKIEPLGSVDGLFEGLALLADGRMIASDRIAADGEGALRLFAADGALAGHFQIGEALRGPGRFAIDPRRNRLWLPLTQADRVLIFNLTADLRP